MISSLLKKQDESHIQSIFLISLPNASIRDR